MCDNDARKNIEIADLLYETYTRDYSIRADFRAWVLGETGERAMNEYDDDMEVVDVDGEETKAERFARIAVPRVGKALTVIEQIGSMAGQNASYEYTDEDADKIISALSAAVTAMGKALRSRKAVSKFTL